MILVYFVALCFIPLRLLAYGNVEYGEMLDLLFIFENISRAVTEVIID